MHLNVLSCALKWRRWAFSNFNEQSQDVQSQQPIKSTVYIVKMARTAWFIKYCMSNKNVNYWAKNGDFNDLKRLKLRPHIHSVAIVSFENL